MIGFTDNVLELNKMWRTVWDYSPPTKREIVLAQRLACAALNGLADDVAKLLSAGANPNYTCDQNALYNAAGWAHEGIVVMLLDHGAKMDYKDLFGRDAAYYPKLRGQLIQDNPEFPDPILPQLTEEKRQAYVRIAKMLCQSN